MALDRVPYEPVDRILWVRSGVPRATRGASREAGWNDAQAALQLGVPSNRVGEWRLRGLTVVEADRVAVRLGMSPVEVWGRDVWYSTADRSPRGVPEAGCVNGHRWNGSRGRTTCDVCGGPKEKRETAA